jgi:hypothetical protein
MVGTLGSSNIRFALGVATAQPWSPEINGHKRRKKIYRNHVELIGFTGSMPKPKPPRTAKPL